MRNYLEYSAYLRVAVEKLYFLRVITTFKLWFLLNYILIRKLRKQTVQLICSSEIPKRIIQSTSSVCDSINLNFGTYWNVSLPYKRSFHYLKQTLFLVNTPEIIANYMSLRRRIYSSLPQPRETQIQHFQSGPVNKTPVLTATTDVVLSSIEEYSYICSADQLCLQMACSFIL